MFFLYIYPSLRLSFNPLGCSCFFRLHKEDRFLYQKKESLTVITSPTCDHPNWKSLSGFRHLGQVVSFILDVIVYKSSKTHRNPKQFCPKMCLMYSSPSPREDALGIRKRAPLKGSVCLREVIQAIFM